MWRVAERLRAPFFWAAAFGLQSLRLRELDHARFSRRPSVLSPEHWRVMANLFQFIQEVRSEANKVTWPTRRETLITTLLVVIMVVLASLFFLVVDQSFRLAVKFILSLGHSS